MLNQFKKLVDTTSATIYPANEFEEEYPTALEDKSMTPPSKKFSEELKKIITNLTEGLNYNILNEFTKELIYRQVIYDEDMMPYIQVIKVIQGTVNPKKFLPYLDDNKWIKIIQLSKNYSNFTDLLKETLDSMKKSNPREFNRAESVKYLINKENCEIKIEHADIKFISGLEKVYQKLDNKIETLGGLTLIRFLSCKIPFNSKYKRYVFNRQLTTDNSKIDIDIPFGYLFNLALKHPNNSNLTPKNIQKLNEIIKLAKIITNAVLDVQEYNIFGHVFLNLENLFTRFREIVLYDSIFTIPQSNINIQLMLCKLMFSKEDKFFKDVLNFSLKEYLQIMKLITQLLDKNKHTFIIKVPESLPYRLTRYKTVEILKFMSHDSKINENYLNPVDYSKINYFKKPLIQLDNETFFLPPVPCSSPNFYETLFEPLKEYYRNDDKLGDTLGNRLESVVETLLKINGIKYIRGGIYKFNKNPAECDFIIESDKSVIVIEVKKKVLTRNAKSGIEYCIFMDLSESLLNSQYQALRIEYLLKKKNNQVYFKNSENSKLIKLNKRIIKRISISLFDFGALHNNIFIKHFFTAILTGEFEIGKGDKNLIERFKSFTEYQMKFNELFDKLEEGYKDLTEFCMRTYFLSLDQLLVILNNSNDNNSFDDNLPKPYMINGELDWFIEYDKSKK